MLHHRVHAAVDALNEGLPFPKQGAFLDGEVALDSIAAAEGGKRLPRLVADLQGALQAAGILLVNDGEIRWVETLHFVLQGFQAVIVIKLLHLFSDSRLHIGHSVDAVADGVDEETGAARHDDIIVGFEKLV